MLHQVQQMTGAEDNNNVVVEATELAQVGTHPLLQCPVLQPVRRVSGIPAINVHKPASIIKNPADVFLFNLFAHEHVQR